ncbi:Pyrroline-5-carboxylate reductase [Bacillus thuringiensis serovar huazhongensis BGSC 4BD1]|nr:Pyrroline-5-carboxylate reductase [Bacillus thuringiensis serovar huazhongensis BGSC 4BD1]
MLLILFPAAIVTTITSSFIWSFIWLITDVYRSGLIDKIKMSALLATSLLLVVIVMPYLSLAFFKLLTFKSEQII